MGFFDKIKSGLRKTKESISSQTKDATTVAVMGATQSMSAGIDVPT